MMPEYGYSSKDYRQGIENQRKFRQECLDNIIYYETIYTGFNPQVEERGIILSDNPASQNTLLQLTAALDEKIRTALMPEQEQDINAYSDKTDLYFQYSHDNYFTIPFTPCAERFLNIHRVYSQESVKNQDVLMVGKTARTKLEALKKIKDKLVKDGFSRISFYNVETQIEDYLHGEPSSEGRHYRVIYTSGMTHPSMIAAQALSGDLMGATGDQSFGEAVSADKVLVYECLEHKRTLINDYYQQLKKEDPQCSEILDLLQSAERASDYQRLSLLLTEERKIQLKALSKSFRKSGQLVTYAALSALPAVIIGHKILNYSLHPFEGQFHLMTPFEKLLKAGYYNPVQFVLKNYTYDR